MATINFFSSRAMRLLERQKRLVNAPRVQGVATLIHPGADPLQRPLVHRNLLQCRQNRRNAFTNVGLFASQFRRRAGFASSEPSFLDHRLRA